MTGVHHRRAPPSRFRPRTCTPAPSRRPAIVSSFPPLVFSATAAGRRVRAGALSFPRLLEISQVGRRLVLLCRHQVAVRAHHIDLLPDADMLVALGTNGLDPDRTAHAMVALDDRPGTGQSMVDGRDFVLENVRI